MPGRDNPSQMGLNTARPAPKRRWPLRGGRRLRYNGGPLVPVVTKSTQGVTLRRDNLRNLPKPARRNFFTWLRGALGLSPKRRP